MRSRTILAIATVLASLSLVAIRAADVTGRWTATFMTDVGEQTYIYQFIVKGSTLTGTARGSLTGEVPIVDGKVDGGAITFVENTMFMEMPVRITYTGRMTSADEIQFERTIADVGTEKLVAKRAK